MYNLNPKSDIPLYMQIVEETKMALHQGLFKEGDQIPSIREMSKNLIVNQSTVSKAYKELEAQGIIQTISGRGSFISINEEKQEEQKSKVLKDLSTVLRQALIYDISEEDLLNLYKEIKKGVEDDY